MKPNPILLDIQIRDLISDLDYAAHRRALPHKNDPGSAWDCQMRRDDLLEWIGEPAGTDYVEFYADEVRREIEDEMEEEARLKKDNFPLEWREVLGERAHPWEED